MKKYHITLDNKTALCGAVTNSPDTFLYNPPEFFKHFAGEHSCKRCKKNYDATHASAISERTFTIPVR